MKTATTAQQQQDKTGTHHNGASRFRTLELISDSPDDRESTVVLLTVSTSSIIFEKKYHQQTLAI